jgi:hypothetical protein
LKKAKLFPIAMETVGFRIDSYPIGFFNLRKQ